METYADEITSGIWLGSEWAGTSSLEDLKNHNIVAIIAVGKGLETPYIGKLEYLCVPAYDIPGFSLISYFPQIVSFMEENRSKGSLLVHCAQGVSRSATVMIAYLMKTLCISRREAEWKTRQKHLWETLSYNLTEREMTEEETAAYQEYQKKFSKKGKEAKVFPIMP